MLAKSRANMLRDGMNLSYLEQYWLGNPAIFYSDYLNLGHLPYVKTQLPLIRSLGFETLRLPITFDKWEDGIPPYSIDSVHYFSAIDSIITWCSQYNLYVVIDFHHGRLNDLNYATEAPRVVDLWKEIALHYAGTDPNRVFFELYNEPFDISDQNWKSIAISIINSIRPLVPNHTLIVGANDYNSLYKLFTMGVLPDTNLIYTFHFYEPMVFTHQGASWVSGAISTTGVPFPYDSATMPPPNPLVYTALNSPYSYFNYPYDGNCTAIQNSLNIASYFATMYNVPIWCGEFGSYKPFAPGIDDRCRYTDCVKNQLDVLHIPYAYWEWDMDFSIFNGTPSLNNLPICMQVALDIIPAPLPVKLVSFSGYNENENNILQWITSSEINNAFFEVERSRDAVSFYPVGKVPGNGNTNISHSYLLSDLDAPSGISYYRLRQVDYNGNFEYSDVISVYKKSRITAIRLFPNPASGQLFTNSGESFNWVITSAQGSELIRKENTDQLDISSLPFGIYFARLITSSGEIISTQKFIRE